MSRITNLTEMAEFFPEAPAEQPGKTVQRVILVPNRFWHPGDTYEMALARRQEAWDRLQAKIDAKSKGQTTTN